MCLQQRFILQNRQFKCPHVTWTLTKTSILFFFQILLFTVRINTVKRLNLQNYDNCKELFLSKFSVANFLWTMMDVQIQLDTCPRCPNIWSNYLLRGFLVPPRAQKYTSEFGLARHLNPFCQIRVKWAYRQPRNYQYVRTDGHQSDWYTIS